MPVQTYPFPALDRPVSRLGYGCMHLGRWDRNPLTAEERDAARAAVEAALEGGITLFDHADIYAYGKSETLFGAVLREQPTLRDGIVVQSKCGIRFAGDPSPSSPQRYDFSRAHLEASVEASLQRLGLDHLDVLLLHRPDALVEPEEVAAAFDALHRSGKVRAFGVSNHTAAQIELLAAFVDQPLCVNQVELSLLHPHLVADGVVFNRAEAAYTAGGGTLDYCRRHGIRLQAWAPLGGGRLFDPGGDAPAALHHLSAVLHETAASLEATPTAAALAWLLRHPAGIQPLLGTTRPHRIAEACAADALEMGRAAWYRLLNAARGEALP